MLQNSNETFLYDLQTLWPLFLSSANFGKSLRFAGKCNFLLVEFLLWKCLNMWLLPSSTPFLLRPTDVPQSTNEVVTPFALNLLLDKSFKVHFHHIAHTQCNAMHTFVTHSKCDYNSYLLYRALKSSGFSSPFRWLSKFAKLIELVVVSPQ